MTAEKPAISLAEQVRCVGREIGLRKNVYPRWVERAQFGMTAEKAAAEIAAMEAVLVTLKALQAQQREAAAPTEWNP